MNGLRAGPTMKLGSLILLKPSENDREFIYTVLNIDIYP